ncbi:DNA-binding transcriptional response regulator, NtrC family, contains REC, AAA-type ATPase, and a Fis-type DNA-binding domains [Candidatus Kryptonium thompsonii]|uniref:DNA-binding transcriptional response regulator, NtrC family, contains REC, AAA-type ATPase, and a Fis-type DNA-binding domains n=1 Tax=Candidatus Kryptonium thompsonii TaxID=1633631 RepID=A0A0N7MVV2_9BACT|nr:sigma-54 dependent transcriptional regulator [Candidatus Kryptonium thompsoni]CUS78727.1 DNA-binding transcriptional response regulator, NtrC family, contains REC, AAA-type ATPase, and a Fis-type DNA-binding domains [Candidatus Kryptonium thompsoni]CUS83521.1 DNA-binding transcriptional response regulator, NtrC family, contains REC, AAA-type ATPase, and a Fis-type DNA-binding domains [Candidatus Kryptonium thompsoni]CUS85923.1 DNA-binding transcriptional response regulator, NtrC family, conta
MNYKFKIFLISTSRAILEDVKRFIPTEEGYFDVSLISSYNSLRKFAIQNPDLAIVAISNDSDEILLETAVELFGSQTVACVDYIKSYALTVKLIKLRVLSYFSMPEESTSFSDFLKGKVEDWKKKSDIEKLLTIRREQFNFSSFIGNSEKIRDVIALVKKAIEHRDLTVLITGETGTGKNLIARIIHQNTYSDIKPFVEINCASIPPTLLESELFGHEKGAFTDAKDRKMGLFEVASGGTIFLDEIGDLDFNLQGKILKVLEDKTFRRVGGVETLKFEGRIIAATNKNLEHLVAENKFRRDLYYRLMLLPIYLPPLRERGDDIFILAEYYMNKFNELYRKNLPKLKGISPEAKALLKRYPWPGNVRELKHAIERAVILSDGEYLTPDDFKFLFEKKPASLTQQIEEASSNIQITLPFESASLKNLERELIKSVLVRVSGNKSRASKILGISRPRLDRLIQKYRINNP